MAWQTGKMARMVTRPRGLVNGHIRQFFCHDCDGSQQYKYNTESLPSGNTKLAGKKVKLIVFVVNSRRELHPHVKFCSGGGGCQTIQKEKKNKRKEGMKVGEREGGRGRRKRNLVLAFPPLKLCLPLPCR